MIKNFIHLLRRYTMSSVLNIIGLSVAFAAFMVLFMQINYDLLFDRFHTDSDRIYRVEMKDSQGVCTATVPRGFVEAFGTSSPLIESYALVEPSTMKQFFTVEQNGKKSGFMDYLAEIYPSYAELFDLEIVEGSANVLEEPSKVIIPKTLAKKLFGNESSLGKLLFFESDTLEVGGVYKDLPENSQFDNHIYKKIGEFYGKSKEGEYRWSQWNFFLYVKLSKTASKEDVVDNFLKNFDLADKVREMGSSDVEMTLMSDLYFDTQEKQVGFLIKHGSRSTVNIMIAIAFLILFIAAINFINFSTSLAPMRMKSINIQKVLGALNLKLRLLLISEAVFLCIISFVIALSIVELLSESSFRDLTVSGISLSENTTLALSTGAIALLLGLVAGIYPALYTTRFAPAMILKGSFAMSKKGKMLRTSLIGFQFIVSIILIIASIFMQMQNNYLKAVDTGLDKENIAIIELGKDFVKGGTFRDLLVQSPLIEDIAYSQYNIGGSNDSQGWDVYQGEKNIQFRMHAVSWNFPALMGIEIAEGRLFNEEDSKKNGYTFLFNEKATKQYDFGFEDKLLLGGTPVDVAGIAKDFNFMSLRYEIEPMAFMIAPRSWLNVGYIKLKGNPYQAVDHIKKAAAEINPEYPIDIQFYDQVFNNLYQKEQKSTALITLFSILTIIISLVGVFGLVLFETQYRRKEIGLRRINGATVATILTMFNRKFVYLVLLCFVIATPIAWYGVSEWLTEFAYRTPLYWWVFLVALLIVLLITIATVTIQSWHVANENPVNSLKSE